MRSNEKKYRRGTNGQNIFNFNRNSKPHIERLKESETGYIQMKTRPRHIAIESLKNSYNRKILKVSRKRKHTSCTYMRTIAEGTTGNMPARKTSDPFTREKYNQWRLTPT